MPEWKGQVYSKTWGCEEKDNSREEAELPWLLKEAHVGPILVQISTLHQVTRKLHTPKCMLQKGPHLSLLTHWGFNFPFGFGGNWAVARRAWCTTALLTSLSATSNVKLIACPAGESY
jgi:hypothetical protein